MSKAYVYDWRWKLKSSPEDLWAYAADTHHLNLVTGMPKIVFTEVLQSDGSVRRYAHAPIYSWLSLDWEEIPFDWVKPLRHSVKRVFSTRLFPIKWLQNVFNFYPQDDGGTELQFELTLAPNGLLGGMLIPGIAKGVHTSFERAFQQIDGYVQNQVERPFETEVISIKASNFERFQTLMQELRATGHDEALLALFEQHLRHSAVEDLTRMRPFAFARKWNADRIETLSLFLHGASIGLLDLSWDILCPECRGAKYQTGSLGDLPTTVHCPSCNIDYESYFDRSVEATFSINPEIAPATRTDYCIGGPHSAPHVLVQQVLQPGEKRTATFPLKPGHYRLRAPRLGGADVRTPAAVLTPLPGQPWITASSDYITADLDVRITGEDVWISTGKLRSGEVTLNMSNETGGQQLLIFEDGEWSEQIATAADVTAIQAFRKLFSSEALRPGYTVGIQNMVVLFSDLKDSTALYQLVGDAAAFGTVIDHFGILRRVIADNRGGIVKTIGDSVMAVFRDPLDGMHAALEMIERIDDYNANFDGQPLTLKVGLHQGPCIAVNLNDRLDYFGSTVNIAARLEGQSRGDDVVT
ncbi:MAG TPA: DUF5939 domain-containing protein [Aggregatilineales bacterium]|nr:DUF5939 domain-containing protein [Aggregatilineales bacterium]